MKKRDFILIGAVLVLAFICWVVPRAAGIFAGRMPHGCGSLWAEKNTELTACPKIRS